MIGPCYFKCLRLQNFSKYLSFQNLVSDMYYMKYLGLLLFLLFSTKLFGQVCADNVVIMGEASSFERIDNKVVKVSESYLLPRRLSEHIGDFKSLILKSSKQLVKIEILGKKVSLKKSKHSYRTVNFNLYKTLNDSDFEGEFTLKVFGVDGFTCEKKFLVVVGD